MSFQSRSGATVTQWDLELLYGRVIQWAFLTSKARKCSRDQEKQAMVCEIIFYHWARCGSEMRFFDSLQSSHDQLVFVNCDLC